MTDAVVVGSGPNGLAAAITLARAGMEVTVLEAADDIGGGTRSYELMVPGVLHDVCSAVHPFGAVSPFVRSLDDLRWRWPEIDLAHPLDGGRAAVMMRDIDETATRLGRDGTAWRLLFGGVAGNVTEDVFMPLLHLPRHPLSLGRFGVRALPPAVLVARTFHSPGARALFGGAAAHSFYPLHRPLTSAAGVLMIAAGHRTGWPVAEGGSRSITAAMASLLHRLGGTINTGARVTSLPAAPLVLLDVAPGAAADIIGDRLPVRVRRAYRKYRHGPGAFKVDLVVRGGVPWTNEACHRAGTLHLAGTLDEIAFASREVHAGRMPERPFVLVAQQYLADPGRSNGDLHPVWAYAHVPNGFTGDATDAVLGQIERFAPGVRDCIVDMQVRGPPELQTDNANYVGGDISTGANDPMQLVFRPRVALDPYSTAVPGVYLCSAATPPGGGVHGMCGVNAAQSALRALRRGHIGWTGPASR